MGQPIQSVIASADNYLESSELQHELSIANEQYNQISRRQSNNSSIFATFHQKKPINFSHEPQNQQSSKELFELDLSDDHIKLIYNSRIDPDSLHRSSRQLDSILLSFNRWEMNMAKWCQISDKDL